jgi:hypothetical protein
MHYVAQRAGSKNQNFADFLARKAKHGQIVMTRPRLVK